MALQEGVMQMRYSSPVACPHCHREDAVQKVSAVVESGSSTGVQIGRTVGRAGGQRMTGYVLMVSRQQTTLSSLLAPPRPPRNVWGIITIGATILFPIPLVCLGSQLVQQGLALLFSSALNPQETMGDGPSRAFFLVSLCCLFLMCLLAVILLVRSERKTAPIRNAQFQAAMALAPCYEHMAASFLLSSLWRRVFAWMCFPRTPTLLERVSFPTVISQASELLTDAVIACFPYIGKTDRQGLFELSMVLMAAIEGSSPSAFFGTWPCR